MTVAIQDNNIMAEIEDTQKLVAQLMRTKHYQNMGELGIFAIVQKAKSVGMNPIDALGGGMYFVQGKVELSSNAMNYLIRAAGHSIVKDAKSDNTVCILHGKRKDNGDTWTVSFSIEEAKRAGIFKASWDKYPSDMLFARALTRLARQLFPDVTRGCYVEGEISQAPGINEPVRAEDCEIIDVKPIAGKEQIEKLIDVMQNCSEEYRTEVKKKISSAKISMRAMPLEFYNVLIAQAETKRDENIEKSKVEFEEPQRATNSDCELSERSEEEGGDDEQTVLYL